MRIPGKNRPVLFALIIGLFIFFALVLNFLINIFQSPFDDGFEKELGKGYSLVQTSPGMAEIVNQYETNGIPPDIIQIAWNQNFILAVQQVLGPRGDFPGDDFLVPVPGKLRYWIIDINHNHWLGPLTGKDFEAEKAV